MEQQRFRHATKRLIGYIKKIDFFKKNNRKDL